MNTTKTIRRSLAAVLLLAGVMMFRPTAPAAAEGGWDDFHGSLGGSVVVWPEFEGSNRYTVKVLPLVDLRYRRFFLSFGDGVDDGLGFDLIEAREWTVAPVLRYRLWRNERQSELLYGLGDIDGGAEAGLLIRWQPGPASLSLKAYQGLGSVEGLTVELGARYAAFLGEGLKGAVDLGAMFTDGKYNRSYFGITPAQSLASGYQVYDPGAGLKHVLVAGTLGYALTERLELGLKAEYKRLTGPAADSPIVERGSANQFLSSMSLSFNF